MKLSKVKKQKRRSNFSWLKTGTCPNCKQDLKIKEGHFVPPCFGDKGFFICDKKEFAPQHHIWCNYQSGPAESCKQCKGLKASYPEISEDTAGIKLAEKYFPNAVILTDTKEQHRE